MCIVFGVVLIGVGSILLSLQDNTMTLKEFYNKYQAQIESSLGYLHYCEGAEAQKVALDNDLKEQSSGVVSCLVGTDILLVEYKNSDLFINEIQETRDGALYQKKSLFNKNVLVFKKEIDYYIYDDVREINNLILANNNKFAISDIYGQMETISVPVGVNVLGAYCFTENALTLSFVQIFEGLKQINSFAFSKSRNVINFKLPDELIVLQDGALSGIGSFVANENNMYFKVVDGVVYSYDGMSLLCYPTISNNTSFSVPDSVQIIKPYAFQYVYKLTSVTIPNSVQEIGAFAFANSSVENVLVGDGVSKILYKTFFSSKLNSFVVGKNINYIHHTAFNNCISLLNFSVNENNSLFVFQGNSLLSRDLKTLYFVVNMNIFDYEIPSAVEVVKYGALSSLNYANLIIKKDIKNMSLKGYSNDNFTTIQVWDKSVLLKDYLFEPMADIIYVKSDIDSSDCAKLNGLYSPSQDIEEIDGTTFAVWELK